MSDVSQSRNVPVRDYGNFDPLCETINYINACACGCSLTRENVVNDFPLPEQMGLNANAKIVVRRYFVRCPACGNRGPATKQIMYAVLQWNMCDLSRNPSYKEVPLFGLGGLGREEAVAVLQSIRADLRTRIADCEERLKSEDKTKHPGPRYHAKLLLYRAWNYYALYLTSDDDFFRHNPNGVKGNVAQPNSPIQLESA